MSTKSETIVFLCPNGHRLNGPASLEGKPGQCPHCGVKFRVPSRDDPPEEDEFGGQQEMESAGHATATVGGDSGSGEQAIYNFEDSADTSSVPGSGSGSGRIAAGEHHPLAEIFNKLWQERERGTVIEVHLQGGGVLVPERYAKSASGRNYGVFAVRDPDGTYTALAVNWDAVARVALRHLPKLPKSLFD